MSYFLIEINNFELTFCEPFANIYQLKKTLLPFSGSLAPHPYDSQKVILFSKPFTKNPLYYEFGRDNIGLVEKLPNIINKDGEDVAMVLLWVKKGCIGIRSSPFIVEAVNI